MSGHGHVPPVGFFFWVVERNKEEPRGKGRRRNSFKHRTRWVSLFVSSQCSLPCAWPGRKEAKVTPMPWRRAPSLWGSFLSGTRLSLPKPVRKGVITQPSNKEQTSINASHSPLSPVVVRGEWELHFDCKAKGLASTGRISNASECLGGRVS